MFGKGASSADVLGGRDASREFVRLEDGSDRETDTTKEMGACDDDAAHEYLEGVRLLVVTSGLTLVMFLGMMDISIIATVSRAFTPGRAYLTDEVDIS